MSLVGFRAPQSTEAARRNERGTTSGTEGLVVVETMRARLTGIIVTLSSVAMIAIAGGAALKGW